jgi:hypothetical protein
MVGRVMALAKSPANWLWSAAGTRAVATTIAGWMMIGGERVILAEQLGLMASVVGLTWAVGAPCGPLH